MSRTRALIVVGLVFIAAIAWLFTPPLTIDRPDPNTGFVMLICLVVALVVIVWPEGSHQFRDDARDIIEQARSQPDARKIW